MSPAGQSKAPFCQPQPRVMTWLELWLIVLVATGTHGCLKCSKDGMAFLKDFRDLYLYKTLRRDSALRTKLQKYIDHEIEQLPHDYLSAGKFKGIIGMATLIPTPLPENPKFPCWIVAVLGHNPNRSAGLPECHEHAIKHFCTTV